MHKSKQSNTQVPAETVEAKKKRMSKQAMSAAQKAITDAKKAADEDPIGKATDKKRLTDTTEVVSAGFATAVGASGAGVVAGMALLSE